MKIPEATPDRRPVAHAANPNLRCAQCGTYSAFDFGDTTLCGECYSQKGSCCPEFDIDELVPRGAGT